MSKNSKHKLSVCICLLCGLPAAGKTTLLNSLLKLKILGCTKKKNASKTVDDFCVFLPEANINKVELNSQRLFVGIEYDSLLPSNFNEKQQEQASTSTTSTIQSKERNAEISGVWKYARYELLSLVKALIQSSNDCFQKEYFSFIRPKETKAETWIRFSPILDSLSLSWSIDINEVLIIIDDNMYFRSMRYEYYKIAREYETGFCQIFMEVPIEDVIDRNQQRSKKVPDDVILKMSTTLQVPDPDKNNWEEFSLTVSSSSDSQLEQIMSCIEKAFINPVQPAKPSCEDESSKNRIQCSSSLIHQADLILRKCVAAWLAKSKLGQKLDDLKQLSKQANETKSNILKGLKSGEILVSFQKDSVLELSDAAQDPNCTFYKYIKELFDLDIKAHS
ncbi:unnamed protein product [Lymnaea stagnalis]|uniref:L-seryl-tRNA(Sec) kinase n=1 Tax=Lymnaea stagnalis TaxID=6523 RepID=A0AAV2HVV1_LYMST